MLNRKTFRLILLLQASLVGTLGAEFQAGDFRLGLGQTANGVQLTSLFDLDRERELLARTQPPLFVITAHRAGTTNEVRLGADAGWQHTVIHPTHRGFEIRWERPQDPALDGFAVVATAVADARASAWRWRLRVENPNPASSISRVLFPQLALAPLGDGAAVLFPRGPGEVQAGVWDRRFSFSGTYPNGWCSLQFMAAYSAGERPTGLYFALHDPWGSTKDLGVDSNPTEHTLRLRFEHPAPNMGVGATPFVLSGEAVMQLLRGDWFDAARLYQDWVRREARWWPRLKAHQRADTPQWLRELDAWTMTGGRAADCVSNVIRFQQFLGQPVGFHWYNWHQIPFDNDYPHYFPAKPDFAQGIATLEKAGVRVMPYINGRIWDTHDRGTEDYEFSRLALPAAGKQPDGRPYIETYNSKETNGQKVALAVMCPTTPLWQRTVSDLVLRLLTEDGTSGVYIDQVAAASPVLCMDRAHGHPLGGGHWWNQGYWQMLDTLRRAKPQGTILTTECNSEPFVRWFDGYLTWHWQNDGQVPAFPAVYGGAIQMFGRAYRHGPTKALAFRMKAGQQLVFGEQLGWLHPDLVDEPDNAAFFRQLVQLRARFHRYFYAGEMARPPKLGGAVPKVKADWQWSGEWWVSTDAVLTGAWRLPGERRLALWFVNVSDAPVNATFRLNPAAYGLRAKRFTLRVTRSRNLQPETHALPPTLTRAVLFPAKEAEVWELAW